MAGRKLVVVRRPLGRAADGGSRAAHTSRVTTEEETRRQVAVDQYAASTTKLDARAALHAQFSIAAQPWHQWLFDQIALEPGETAVEMGAGTGLLWTANAARIPAGSRLHLTDLSMAMCQRLRTDIPTASSVSRADAERLPFRDHVADVVLASHMLYHVPDQRRALDEAARLLRPHGRVLFATNGREHMKELQTLLVAIGARGAEPDPLHNSFALEDAQTIIEPVFPNATRTTFEDGLHVTEPRAVVDYIESFVDLNAAQRRQLVNEIRVRMTDGHLAITKVAGVVTAKLA
jgi:ubiquinone/menaquinone biosynthesis C-methylase UbiE